MVVWADYTVMLTTMKIRAISKVRLLATRARMLKGLNRNLDRTEASPRAKPKTPILIMRSKKKYRKDGRAALPPVSIFKRLNR
jgi:hypothetical protein